MTGPPLLRLEALSVELPMPEGVLRPVEGVDLALAPGERVGLVGESGCGKSLTARAVMGLLPSGARASGGVFLEGRDLIATQEAELCRLRGRRLALISQEPMTALNPVKTIGAQVAEGPRLHLRLSRREAAERAARLLDRVGLSPARFPLHLYPHQLSGGQRQRVAIAMALACGPDLLIADEPTTALDVTVQARIMALLEELTVERGMALLLISHDLGLVAEACARIAVMYAGRIVEEAPSGALFDHPAHPYSDGLLAAIPQLRTSAPAGGGPAPLHPIAGEVPDLGYRATGCGFAPRCGLADAACHAAPPPLDARPGERRLACFHPLPGASGR
jgi:peptide/nickel transport system ATP-binding protein